jgi:hypothetical protein
MSVNDGMLPVFQAGKLSADWRHTTDPLTLWEIETDESFSLEDLMQELGRLELQALGRVKHGDPPGRGRTP